MRGLLATATWQDLSPGHVLVREGEVPDRLVYLHQGRVEVRIGEHTVGHGDAGTFVGELTFISQEPATATVTVIEAGRGLVFESSALHRLAGRNPQVKLALLATLGGSTRATLLRRNREMLELGTEAPAKA